MIAPADFKYEGIPWKDGGRTREGVDCAGLAALFLKEELGVQLDLPAQPPASCRDLIHAHSKTTIELERGDLLFFESVSDGGLHVVTYLGQNRWLHILRGYESRIDIGLTLARRLKLRSCGYLRASEVQAVAAALADPKLGGAETIILLIISLALSAISYALAPKLGRIGNKYGRYGFDALVTQNTPEVPLPDLLGRVTVAGNSPYTQQSEKSANGTASSQKANKIVVLGSAPFEEIDYQTGLKINGLGWNDAFFKDGTIDGIFIDPAQTKAEAVDGSISSEVNVPSVSLYTGEYGISVPVDVRAEYDREFPVYGLAGSSYLVFRLINSTKFQNFNVTCRVKGRKCRTFDANGFIVTSVVSESLAGAGGGKVRFKLANDDIIAVSSVTVDGVPFAEISASAQTGDVYQLNKTKGFIEFITAPGTAAVILVSYTYYPREWSRNPATQIVYLLTEKRRGMGFDGTQIDWQAAVDFRDYCDEVIEWESANGPVSEARYVSDYAIDFRKPIQEHIQAIIDASNAALFVSNGKFTLAVRSVAASVMSFTTANIKAGTFRAELMDRTDRPNRVKVLFHSDEAHNAESEVMADDQANQRSRAARVGNDGIVETNLKLPAVTVPSQAERLAEIYVREMVGTRYLVQFTASIKGLPLQPYDVVDITHPSQPAWSAKLFRIELIEHDAEDRLVITALEYVESAPI